MQFKELVLEETKKYVTQGLSKDFVVLGLSSVPRFDVTKEEAELYYDHVMNPQPEPPKPTTVVPPLPLAYAQDFGAQPTTEPTVAEPVRASVSPSVTTSEASEAREASPAQPAQPNFLDIATHAAERGEKRILPIWIGGKNPTIKWAHEPIHDASTAEWEGLYSKWIQELAAKFPNANACTVARADEHLYIDEDKSKQFRDGYEKFAGEVFPRTHTTSGRPDRAQSGWKQTDYSRTKLWNIVQGKTKDQMFSLRFNNMYVLAEGSRHKTSSTYEAIDNSPLAPIPDKLVDYILSCVVNVTWERGRRVSEGNEEDLDAQGTSGNWFDTLNLDAPFIHGDIDNQVKDFIWYYIKEKNVSDGDQLFEIIKNKFEQNGCYEPDGSEFHWNQQQIRDKCRAKAKTIRTRAEEVKEITVKALAESAKIVSDVLAATTQPTQPPNIALNMKPNAQAAAVVPPIPEIDTSEGYIRPEFPYWAIQGTSIWDGLVAPALKTSSKHAEFIAMPAIQIMLNALSGEVRVGLGNSNHNIFVGLVSPYGEFFKSSSCALAMDYFKHMGKLFAANRSTKTSEGRTAVIQAGSPEGFGMEAYKLNATRALLFNDELGKFVSKAGIEGSSFSSDLLTWYGAGEFGNRTTVTKNAFHFETGSYTFGWLWATTDRGFNRHWPKLAGISSGLEDRMFFVVSPEKPKPTAPYSDPLFQDGATKTAQLIDKAIAQKTFQFQDPDWYAKKVSGMDPRSMDLVQKLCLYLCVDMGGTVIEDEHIDRALALVQYRNQAASFLAPIEADNKQAQLQKEIIRELRQHRGKMSYRDLCRNLDYHRYGADVWKRAYYTMLPSGNDEGTICEWQGQTTTGKRATRMVGLIKYDDESAG